MLTRFKPIPLPQVKFLDIKNHPSFPGTETECACMLSHVWLFVTPWTAATRLLCSRDSPGKNTAVGCHFLLQGIFLTQISNRVSFISCIGRHSLPLSHLGSHREGDALTNEDFTYNKRVTAFLFSELLLYRLFLNNNQLRIIRMPEAYLERGACPARLHVPHQHVYHIAKHSVLPSLPSTPEERSIQALIHSH